MEQSLSRVMDIEWKLVSRFLPCTSSHTSLNFLQNHAIYWFIEIVQMSKLEILFSSIQSLDENRIEKVCGSKSKWTIFKVSKSSLSCFIFQNCTLSIIFTWNRIQNCWDRQGRFRRRVPSGLQRRSLYPGYGWWSSCQPVNAFFIFNSTSPIFSGFLDCCSARRDFNRFLIQF